MQIRSQNINIAKNGQIWPMDKLYKKESGYVCIAPKSLLGAQKNTETVDME